MSAAGAAAAGATLLSAPAKVNLGLRVLGRRTDGYHEIESLFVPVDWTDELELELVAGGTGVDFALAGDCAGVPADARNLAARAAAAFLAESRVPYGVRLRLHKRIPAGAGLGGGSSDAGSVLRALATRLPGYVPEPRLARIALSLGADVPFFLDPRPARVTGIGEGIEPLEGFPALVFLLATPGPPLATAAVYAAFDRDPGALTLEHKRLTLRALSELWGPGGRLRAEVLAGLVANDLEPAARRLHPAIGPLLDELRAGGALAVGLSGSGPTVFGVFEEAAAAERGRLGLVAASPELRVRVAAALARPTT